MMDLIKWAINESLIYRNQLSSSSWDDRMKCNLFFFLKKIRIKLWVECFLETEDNSEF